MEDKEFTHIDDSGNPKMVDVSKKSATRRVAVAQSKVTAPPEVLEKLLSNDMVTKKGPVFHTSIIAGIMAAKKTSEFIPFCHPINLDDCQISINVDGGEIVIRCTAITTGKTGVEMEAMTGASAAALTIYDMCKALSHDIIISQTQLMEKSGGKNDFNRDGA